MQLNETIKKELTVAIRQAVAGNVAFPIETNTSGNIRHQIMDSKKDDGMLLQVIEIVGKDYFIYLV